MNELHHFECESNDLASIAKVSFRFSNVREFFHRANNNQVTEVVLKDGMHLHVKTSYDEFLRLIIEEKSPKNA